jgi:flagellar assembly protein FliH
MACKVLPPGSTVQSINWSNPGAVMGPAANQRASTAAPGRLEQPLPPDVSQDIEARQQKAYEQGIRDGEAKAARETAARIDTMLARLARTVDDLAATRMRVLAEADADIVQLSIAVARRILRRELTVDPDSLAGIVRAALERVPAREISRVRVHPEDAGCVEKHLRAPGMTGSVEVCRDPSLERGSVVFETVRGNLDASVSTQLAEIERGLIDVLRRQA